MIYKKLTLFLFTIFFSFQLFAQGEIEEESKIFYRNEKTWGLFFFSNGWGFDYRYGKRINAARKFIWEADFNYIKHPKEYKVTVDQYTLSRFVYGKMNVAMEFRGSAGFQKELYRKMDKGSVSIRFVYSAGPTLVLLKPIYYQVAYPDGYREEKFDLSKTQIIYGKASFFKGFPEMKIDPGVFLKGSFSFEFSRKKMVVSAIELGASASAFIKELEIMATQNSQFLFNIFISYRFGKIVRGGHMKDVKFEDESSY